MLNDLIKVARRLDSFGLTKEARVIYSIVKSAGDDTDAPLIVEDTSNWTAEQWDAYLNQDPSGYVDPEAQYQGYEKQEKNDRYERELKLHNQQEQYLLNEEESHPRFTRTQRETRQNGERALELLESMSAEQREELLMDHPDAMWKLFGIRATLYNSNK